MKTIKFLVLSDLHFGDLAAAADFSTSNLSTRHMITNQMSIKDTLIDLVKGKHIDFILASGDLTSRARPSEFIGAKRVISEIANGAGISSDSIFGSGQVK